MIIYVLGYLSSAVLGGLVLWPIWTWLHTLVERMRREEDEKIPRVFPESVWVPILLGSVERIVITTLVGWNVSGAAAFIGAWISIKAIGMGWPQLSSGSKYARAAFAVHLILSAGSALFGIFGGLIIWHYAKPV